MGEISAFQQHTTTKNLKIKSIKLGLSGFVYFSTQTRKAQLILNAQFWQNVCITHPTHQLLPLNGCCELAYFCVQEVEPNSPAAQAGLRAQTDYIIGSDTWMNEVQAPADESRYSIRAKVGGGLIPSALSFQSEDLFSIVEEHEGREMKMYVYNTDTDNCREVLITPNRAWGGEGRYGEYHRHDVCWRLR